MPSVPAVIVENVSVQIIRIIYKRGLQKGFTVVGESINTATSGELQLAPKKRLTLQSDRVNLGQLANLEAKGLLTVTNTILSSS